MRPPKDGGAQVIHVEPEDLKVLSAVAEDVDDALQPDKDSRCSGKHERCTPPSFHGNRPAVQPRVHAHVRVHVHVHIYMYRYMCMDMYMCMCMYLNNRLDRYIGFYIYIYIYIEREIHPQLSGAPEALFCRPPRGSSTSQEDDTEDSGPALAGGYYRGPGPSLRGPPS